GAVAGGDHLGEQLAEPFVGPGGAPLAPDRRVDLVEQAGTAAPRRRCGGLEEEPGGDELGQVLADGVVGERELGVELGDVDAAVALGDVAEDGVAGRVAECSRLFLEGGALHRGARLSVSTSSSGRARAPTS